MMVRVVTTYQVSIMSKVDCIVVHVAGAVYSCGDTIVFEVLQQIGGQMYLSVVVQCEQVLENTYTFRWDNIPDDVSSLYEYVNCKSSMHNDVLFGTHIARPDDREYAICKFLKPVIGETREITEWQEATPSFFKHFVRQLKKTKNIV